MKDSTVLEKRLLNCRVTDPNRILPIKYVWARDYYRTAVANTWVPEEISMHADVELWRSSRLSSDERRLILWNLGFFSTGESLTANNVVLAIYKHVTNPECRQYLLRQAYEEAVHTETFIYICDSLGLDPDDVFKMYLTIPTISAKDEFVVELTGSILDPNFSPNDLLSKQALLRDLIGYYIIMEGIFFYAGFAMMLSFIRHNKMRGIAEQFWLILRDESIHVAFGADLIRTIVQENPEVWTEEFQGQVRRNAARAIELECQYARDALPRGILGLTAESVQEYVRYVASRRLRQLGLSTATPENPLTWMSEAIDLPKEKFIFESRVAEYKHGSVLKWDE